MNDLRARIIDAAELAPGFEGRPSKRYGELTRDPQIALAGAYCALTEFAHMMERAGQPVAALAAATVAARLRP